MPCVSSLYSTFYPPLPDQPTNQPTNPPTPHGAFPRPNQTQHGQRAQVASTLVAAHHAEGAEAASLRENLLSLNIAHTAGGGASSSSSSSSTSAARCVIDPTTQLTTFWRGQVARSDQSEFSTPTFFRAWPVVTAWSLEAGARGRHLPSASVYQSRLSRGRPQISHYTTAGDERRPPRQTTPRRRWPRWAAGRLWAWRSRPQGVRWARRWT
jgi:hypothetical protein